MRFFDVADDVNSALNNIILNKLASIEYSKQLIEFAWFLTYKKLKDMID